MLTPLGSRVPSLPAASCPSPHAQELMSDEAWYKSKYNFWGSVYGFDMTVMQPSLDLPEVEPPVEVLPKESICSNCCVFHVQAHNTLQQGGCYPKSEAAS